MRLIVLAVATLLPAPAALSQVIRARNANMPVETAKVQKTGDGDFIRGGSGRAATAAANGAGTPLRLSYDHPAANDNDGWVSQSLPLGNGYMGVNLFGGVQQDRLQLTENSLVDAPTEKIGGLNNLAEVFLEFPHTAPSNYSRDLVLNTATAHVSYDDAGVSYQREYFASYPDKVFVIRLRASKAGALEFTLHPTIPYLADFRHAKGDNRGKHGAVKADGNTITLAGTMDYYGIKFEGQFKVLPQGGNADGDEF